MALTPSNATDFRRRPCRDVIPPDSALVQAIYNELAQDWWMWAVSVPAATNPLLDTTGEFAHEGQPGGLVFFLAGHPFGGKYERTVEVPAGRFLFFPVINSIWWAPDDLGTARYWAEEVEHLNTSRWSEEKLLRFIAAYSIQGYRRQDPPQISAEIDGCEVANLVDYRAVSPEVFTMEDTDLFDDLFEVELPNDLRYVADGYWVLVKPLKPGQHTIRFAGRIDAGPFAVEGPFEVEVTYHINVKPFQSR
jgi:hypothetical protein